MTKMVQGVSCEICKKQKAPGEIHPRESQLLRGVKLLVCNQCEENKFEPRAFIVLVARKKDRGPAAVKDYIKHHRYVGEAIQAKEILG